MTESGFVRCDNCRQMVSNTRDLCNQCAAGVSQSEANEDDMLNQIYNKHVVYRTQVLDVKLGKSNGGWSEYNRDDPLDKKIHSLCTAIIHETVELDRLTGWKWWKTPKEFDIPEAKEELIDIFHFMLNMFIELEMGPEQILHEYMRKRDININRQLSKY